MVSLAKPNLTRSSLTFCLWLPCNSIFPFFTVPPHASEAFSFLASSFMSISLSSRPLTTVFTLPNFFFSRLTLMRWLSFAMVSQTQSSLGSPHFGQISVMPFLVLRLFFHLLFYHLLSCLFFLSLFFLLFFSLPSLSRPLFSLPVLLSVVLLPPLFLPFAFAL